MKNRWRAFLPFPIALVSLAGVVELTAAETDPASAAAAQTSESSTNDLHWSLRPVTRPTVPAVALSG